MRTFWPTFPSRTQLLLASFVFFIHVISAQDSTPTPSPTAPSSIKQPIIHPSKPDVVTPGSPYLIEWTPDPHFSNVTIELWDKTSWGYSRDFGTLCYHWVNPFCGTITTHAPNTGQYLWQVPNPGNGFLRGERVFWIKMYVDDFMKPDIGNSAPVLSYSQNFAFEPEPGQPWPVETDTSSDPVPGPTPIESQTVSETLSVTREVNGTTPTSSVTTTRRIPPGATEISSLSLASRLETGIIATLLIVLGIL